MDVDTTLPNDVQSGEEACDYLVQHLKNFNLTGKRVRRIGKRPVAVGGFADVCQGAIGRKQVAIKVTRLSRPKPDIVAQKVNIINLLGH